MRLITFADLFATYPDACVTRSLLNRDGEGIEVRYRLASMEDLDELYESVLAAKQHLVAQGIIQWTDDYPLLSHFIGDIENQQQCVGLIDGEIAFSYVLNKDCLPEYASGKWKDASVPYLVLHRLCVHPRWQEMGFGRQVLKHLLEQLQAMGYGAVRLDVYDGNTQANKMYLRKGFEQVGSFEMSIGTINLMELYC
ncbi:MAG: GNAT family N-acetyltransferase [Akkermansia sp.]